MSKNIPLGQYLNPDDIAKHIDLSSFLERTTAALSVEETLLDHVSKDFETFFAAISAQAIAIGLRNDWLESGLSLTYEPVAFA